MRPPSPAQVDRREFVRAARESVQDAKTVLGLRAAPELAEIDRAPRGLSLVNHGHGLLRWQDSTSDPAAADGPETSPESTSLVEIPNEILAPNQILARLEAWDGRLNPNQGLRRWSPVDGRLHPIRAVPPVEDSVGKPGGILLLLHGTFSSGDAIADQLASIESQAHFFAWAASRYEHILSFDHPTLSVSPVLNGLDLARLFGSVKSPVDVIAHSRGGLVARWWLEAFAGMSVGPRRVIFVSSPLGGTSLASPPRLREAFDLFTTVGAHLKMAGAAASVFLPFTMVAVALLQVFQTVTGALARTDLSDLFFATIPGLGGMSRVGHHGELDRLHSGTAPLPDYFAVRSDFQMESAGWRFWKNFQHPALHTSQWGADRIFDAENDLVVDNRSTIEIYKGQGLPADRIQHFATNGEIHHTNYFTRVEVIEAFRRFLD